MLFSRESVLTTCVALYDSFRDHPGPAYFVLFLVVAMGGGEGEGERCSRIELALVITILAPDLNVQQLID